MKAHDAYEPCRSCQRHVKREDAACPFCGAARSTARTHVRREMTRISRAHWLAFGSTLVGIGCNGSMAAEPFADAGAAPDDAATARVAPDDATTAPHDASAADDRKPDEDAPADAARREAGYPSPDTSCPRRGTFACGGSMNCDRATEVCFNSQCASIATVGYLQIDSGACAACPTCACFPPGRRPDCTAGVSCFEDNFGGLTVSCSQAGCYGSPPVRLDRPPFVA